MHDNATLAARLRERRRFIQVVAGPRQIGKTTLVTQIRDRLALPHRYASADDPGLRGTGWIEAQWGDAPGRRVVAVEVKSGRAPSVHDGLDAFRSAHRADRIMIVGGDGSPVAEFLSTPVATLLAG